MSPTSPSYLSLHTLCSYPCTNTPFLSLHNKNPEAELACRDGTKREVKDISLQALIFIAQLIDVDWCSFTPSRRHRNLVVYGQLNSSLLFCEVLQLRGVIETSSYNYGQLYSWSTGICLNIECDCFVSNAFSFKERLS